MNPVPFTTLAAAMDFVVGDRNYPLSELFMKGGFIMWPLLLLSIAGVVVLVMCCFSTRAAAVLPTKLVEQAESFIRKRDYTGLSILCKNGDSCYARVMLTVANFMLRNPSAQFEEVREIGGRRGGSLDYDGGRPDAWDSRHPGLCIFPQPCTQTGRRPGGSRHAQCFRSCHPASEATSRCSWGFS